jgi:hypothetical protein
MACSCRDLNIFGGASSLLGSGSPQRRYLSDYFRLAYIIICMHKKLISVMEPENNHRLKENSWTTWTSTGHDVTNDRLVLLGSNPGRDTYYPDWGFAWFPTVSPDNCWDGTSIKSQSLLDKSFPTRDSSTFTHRFDLLKVSLSPPPPSHRGSKCSLHVWSLHYWAWTR